MQLYHDDGRWEFIADANTDLEFRFLGTSNNGKMYWREDESWFEFDNPLAITTIKSGATQGAAGASANEIWKTNGHATLPNNVLMIGV